MYVVSKRACRSRGGWGRQSNQGEIKRKSSKWKSLGIYYTNKYCVKFLELGYKFNSNWRSKVIEKSITRFSVPNIKHQWIEWSLFFLAGIKCLRKISPMESLKVILLNELEKVFNAYSKYCKSSSNLKCSSMKKILPGTKQWKMWWGPWRSCLNQEKI